MSRPDPTTWLEAGVTTAREQKTLLAAGVTPEPEALRCVRVFGDCGMTTEQIAGWWPTRERDRSFRSSAWVQTVAILAHNGFTPDDVAEYEGSALDPLMSSIGAKETARRIKLMAGLRSRGWTAQDWKAVADTAPERVDPIAWVDVWCEFMPLPQAAAYARANIGFKEAVTFETTSTRPDQDVLVTLAALCSA